MPESRVGRMGQGKEPTCEPRMLSPGRSALPRIGLMLLLACWTFRSYAQSIQHITNAFVFSGANFTITVSDTNSSIQSVTEAGQTNSIFGGGEFGLWSLTNEDGSDLNAAQFSPSSTSNTFNWTLAPPSNVLVLSYSNSSIGVTITLSNRGDGVDFAALLQPHQETVLEFDLPARMRFTPTNVQRLICPLNSSDGVGAAFNSAFFQSQPESDPAGWSPTLVGDAGYISLYGGPLLFQSDAPVPVGFTTEGIEWLGTNVETTWNKTNAIVNRPPAAGQSDLILLNSTNGPYFSASHLGGRGFLFRLGGEVADTNEPLAEALVIAAIEHLAQSSPAGRTNIALLNLQHGPASGGWAAVPVTNWNNLLQTSTVLAQAGIQVVELPDAQAMLDALASTSYLAILNPYGEWTPVLESTGMTGAVSAIGSYVRAGGNWFETGGYSFYYALTPDLYYSYNVPYPPAFADFLQLETSAGKATLYGVQPLAATPWAGSNNPAALFIPGRLAWAGDSLGGFCEHAFGTYVAPGQTWPSPIVRLTVGYAAPDALSNYCQASGYNRGLQDKMSPTVLNAFESSVLVYYAGTCADKIAHLTQLPTPALVHFADYLLGGFDKEYPDYLPPNASFGTSADFTNFLAQAHQLGLLIMPYTNPTWWPDSPAGPTFLRDGTAPLLVNLDGTLSYEVYWPNYGYTVCHWHPDVQAANSLAVQEFSTNYPVDVLFEDQCGARTWQYDLNAASPTPYAYADGIASRVFEDSQTLPVSTEDGWDRLVNNESQFCGMAWATVPTANPPSWVSYLRDRYSTTTWDLYPVAQYIAHDKVSFVLHDLGQFVTSDEVLAWTLGLGYGMSYNVNASDLDQAATNQWLLWLDRVQKSVCARYVGQPVGAFAHAWGTNTANPDNGIMQATYGQVNILANLGPLPLTTNNQTLAPFGFFASAPGMIAADVIPSTTNPSPSAISYIAETNSSNTQFWIYTTGEQSATVGLPPGLGGAAIVQMDEHPSSAVQVQNSALTVTLGITPDQDRIEPPPALAGLAPINWPHPLPAIGILNLPGMPSAWTTITAKDWVQAFNQSSLSNEFNLPIYEITNYAGLTAALQAGPTNWFAIINPNGEIFPESGAGQWPTTLDLISNYVDNGGCWWETGGYSFYTSSWFESNAWQTETVGTNGMDSFGLPVGGGANDQPAEPLTVTPAGQTFFGPTLSAQLQGLTSTVNRGLLQTYPDPGHIALLSGATEDFLGGYRLGGWGYLWRVGGFLPTPNVILPAIPAVMTYMYTNPPLPAIVSPVNYLWHGTVTFPAPPVIQVVLGTNGLVTFTFANCPPGATNYVQRSLSLGDNSTWQTVFSFSSPGGGTNWTDPAASSLPLAFYRVRSVLGP
jgi:hypothetical protein